MAVIDHEVCEMTRWPHAPEPSRWARPSLRLGVASLCPAWWTMAEDERSIKPADGSSGQQPDDGQGFYIARAALSSLSSASSSSSSAVLVGAAAKGRDDVHGRDKMSVCRPHNRTILWPPLLSLARAWATYTAAVFSPSHLENAWGQDALLRAEHLMFLAPILLVLPLVRPRPSVVSRNRSGVSEVDRG